MAGAYPEPVGELLTHATQAIREIEPDARVLLFGSQARGEAGPWSDWDLLVVVDGDIPLARRSRIWDRLTDLALDRDDSPLLSALVVRREDVERRRSSVIRNALREGIEL